MKQIILNIFKRHKRQFIALLCLFSIFIIIIFYLGYRIPQNDKHKDWSFFPNGDDFPSNMRILSKGNIIIERIPYSDTEIRDNILASWNNQNFKIVDSSVLKENKFELGSNFHINLMENNGGGGYDWQTRFLNIYLDYIQVKIGNKVDYFKAKHTKLPSYPSSTLDIICQYNIPKNENDTLFFYYGSLFYMAYI